ncbi:MAG: hypothetical protein KKB70_05130 [Proteobacteria bacterium]|nr:hypothetical protein [Pseudomonadota bacterium]MBU1611215.1 hypothetical protein [Pseudomonadota bacterium]
MDAQPGDRFEVEADPSQVENVQRIATSKGAQVVEKSTSLEGRPLITLEKIES